MCLEFDSYCTFIPWQTKVVSLTTRRSDGCAIVDTLCAGGGGEFGDLLALALDVSLFSFVVAVAAEEALAALAAAAKLWRRAGFILCMALM